MDLSQYTPENRLNLDLKRTLEEQVVAYNDNVFGQLSMREDYKFPFSVNKVSMDEARKDEGRFWGSLDSIFRYAMTQCIDMGYIPWKVNYVHFNGTEYNFYLSCEDRRIDMCLHNPDIGLGQP